MTPSNQNLPPWAKTHLKCSSCKNYLSVSPVRINSVGDLICGRCFVISASGLTANSATIAYETLAILTKFPCRYDSHGCATYSNFGNDCSRHEQTCQFKTIKCPLGVENCKEDVKPSLILQHCQKTHLTLISNGQFRLSSGDGFNSQRLIVLDGEAFLFTSRRFKYFAGQTKWGFVLKYFNQTTKERFYQLEMKSKEFKVVLLNQQKLIEYKPELTNKVKEEDLIFFDKSVHSLLDNDNCLYFEIKLIGNDKTSKEKVQNTSNKDWLKDELECLICNEVMAPPIHCCKTGHSVCDKCRSQIDKCPTCEAKYEGARNYTLEKVAEHLDYPCKNQGCNFSGTLPHLRAHLGACAVREAQEVPASVGAVIYNFIDKLINTIKTILTFMVIMGVLSFMLSVYVRLLEEKYPPKPKDPPKSSFWF